jgi:hypothetical protein
MTHNNLILAPQVFSDRENWHVPHDLICLLLEGGSRLKSTQLTLDHRFFGAAGGKHLVESVREAMESLLRGIGRHSYHPHLDETARTKKLEHRVYRVQGNDERRDSIFSHQLDQCVYCESLRYLQRMWVQGYVCRLLARNVSRKPPVFAGSGELFTGRSVSRRGAAAYGSSGIPMDENFL